MGAFKPESFQEMETKIGTYEGPFSKQLFPMFLTYIGTTIKGLPFEINIKLYDVHN